MFPGRVVVLPQEDSFQKRRLLRVCICWSRFIITVMCSDDCEWHWACLFSCNCLFPTEISMSDPFIVLIIACLIFCLPEKAHHSAFGMVGIDYGAPCGVPLQAGLRQLCPLESGLSGVRHRNSGLWATALSRPAAVPGCWAKYWDTWQGRLDKGLACLLTLDEARFGVRFAPSPQVFQRKCDPVFLIRVHLTH